MARVSSHKARTDIYRRGLQTPNPENKRGYSLDKSKPADDTDEVMIPKGSLYFTWQLHRSPKQYSLTYPRPQQLTNSGFLCAVYDLNDLQNALNADNYSDPSELETDRDEIRDQAQDLLDETQNSLDNMPESLQYSPTGELLQERIDALENFINELESIDLDYIEPEDDEVLGDWDGQGEKQDYIDDQKHEHFLEWAQERIDEIQGVSIDC